MKLHTLGIIAIGAFALAACTAEALPAAEPEAEQAAAPTAAPQFRHAVSMNQMMVDVINDHAHAIWDVEIPGNLPETDEDWIEIRHASVVLAAAGSLTVVGGAGENDDDWVTQPSWVAMSQALSDGRAAGTRCCRAS